MSGLQSKVALTAPKEGADVRVGREMGREMGWLLRRTKRVEELIAQPAIMDLCDQLARCMERYASLEEVEVKSLEPELMPSRTKSYITILFGATPCPACGGTGRVTGGQYCSTCDGAGKR